MEARFASKKLAECKLSKLKPHPRQSVFRPHTQREILDLAESLTCEGLISPVEITPDGFIICGHGRVAAAKHLEWDTIRVWVRHDLTAKGDDAVFRRLVQDNLGRRQLSKLGMGRAYLALKEQEREAYQAAGQSQAQGDFRDYLGEILGCDGTTAERWARLAVLPLQYDQLIEMGLLTQQQADKIATCLPADIQEKLGCKLVGIASGNSPRKDKKRQISDAVAARLGSKRDASSPSSAPWPQRFNLALARALRELPAPLAEFADVLDGSDGSQILLSTIQRKFPKEFCSLDSVECDLDQVAKAQLRRSILVMLGALQAAGGHDEG